MKIYFGEWKTDKDPDCDKEEDMEEDCDGSDDYNEIVCYPDHAADISPKKFTIHPEYLRNRGNQYKSSYDIAIIELMRPPRETKITQSIKLPDSETCDDDLDESMLVTGFGKINKKILDDGPIGSRPHPLEIEICMGKNFFGPLQEIENG